MSVASSLGSLLATTHVLIPRPRRGAAGRTRMPVCLLKSCAARVEIGMHNNKVRATECGWRAEVSRPSTGISPRTAVLVGGPIHLRDELHAACLKPGVEHRTQSTRVGEGPDAAKRRVLAQQRRCFVNLVGRLPIGRSRQVERGDD